MRFDRIIYEMSLKQVAENSDSEILFPNPQDAENRGIFNVNMIGKPTSDASEAYEKMLQAQYSVSREFPFLYAIQNIAFNYIADVPGFRTAAVDKSGNFYYNSDFVNNIELGELVFVFIHELLHVIQGDLHEFNDFAPNPTEIQRARWNISADFVNNYFIVMSTAGKRDVVTPPPGLLYPDPDGRVRKVQGHTLPDEHIVDLNNADVWDVYLMLCKFSDELINALSKQVLDQHVYSEKVTAQDIEEVFEPLPPKMEDSEEGSGKPPVDEPLEKSLVRDRKTDQWAVIIRSRGKDSVDIINIPDSTAERIIKKEKGGEMLPQGEYKRILDRFAKRVRIVKYQ